MTTETATASWSAEILTYLKTTAVTHVLWIAVAVGGFLLVRAYISEHDARVAAEAAVKSAQTQIKTIAASQTQTAKAAAVTITVLQKEAAAVTTAPEAVKGLSGVSTVQLDPEAVPDAPQRVAVDAVPLYQELNKCKQCSVNLGATQTELADQKKIDAQKDLEITALKKKPGFWATVKKDAIVIGVSAAVGYAAAKR